MTDLTPEALDALERLLIDYADGEAVPTWDSQDWDTGHVIVTSDQYDHPIADGMDESIAVLACAAVNALPALIDAARERIRLEQAAAEQNTRVRALRAERDALARWKAEALPVMAGLQELGRALGTPLGKSITARESVDLALDLRNERDAARAEVAALRERVEVTARELRGRAVPLRPDNTPEQRAVGDLFRQTAAALDAALTTGGNPWLT